MLSEDHLVHSRQMYKMNQEQREFWNWIWKSDTKELEIVCRKYYKKNNIKIRECNLREGDMEV